MSNLRSKVMSISTHGPTEEGVRQAEQRLNGIKRMHTAQFSRIDHRSQGSIRLVLPIRSGSNRSLCDG